MITISGTLTVKDNSGTNHKIQAVDFIPDEHLDGTSVSLSFGNDTDYSGEIIAEKKNGVISNGNWVVKNCSVSSINISFS